MENINPFNVRQLFITYFKSEESTRGRPRLIKSGGRIGEGNKGKSERCLNTKETCRRQPKFINRL